MNISEMPNSFVRVSSWSVAIFMGLSLASSALAGDYLPPPASDPWCSLTPTSFEAPIRVALDGEREAYNPDNLVSTLPVPIPSPAYAKISEIARLFNQIAVEIIDARSSELKEIFDPLPDPDPPNLETQVRNNVEHALLFVQLLEAKIEIARATGVLSEEGEAALGLYAEATKDLIETLPVPIP